MITPIDSCITTMHMVVASTNELSSTSNGMYVTMHNCVIASYIPKCIIQQNIRFYPPACLTITIDTLIAS